MRGLKRFLLLFVLLCSVLAGVAGSGSAQEKLTFLTVGYSTPLIGILNDSIIPEFEAKYGVEVDMIHTTWGERPSQLAVMIAGGAPPDVVVTGFYSPYEEASIGLLASLDPYLEEWEHTGSIPENLWNTMRWRGKVHVMPQYVAHRVVAYNKTLFREAGMDDARVPQSWSEMADFVRRLTRLEPSGEAVAQAGFTYPWETPEYTDLTWFMMQAGVGAVDATTYRSNLDRPEALESMKALLDIHLAYHGNLEGPWALVEGQTAMSVTWPGSVRWEEHPDVYENTGFFPMRKDPDSRPAAIPFINGLAITEASANKDLAWKFIAHLMDDPYQPAIQAATGWVSPRADLASELSTLVLGLEPFYDMLRYIPDIPLLLPSPRNSLEEASMYMERMAFEEIPPEEAVTRLHELFERLLREWEERTVNAR